MKQFTYLLLLLSPFFAFTQKRLDLVHENAFAFYDYQEKAFCVLDDSTFLWKYDVKKEKWEKSSIELQLEMPFERFLSDFIVMSEKGSPVYFVYAGCGVVFVKNGGTIKRHDHSFYHMNQFSGAFFMDQGEPRIYGGYGLFTSKNIITRYDTISHEWFLINTIGKLPLPGVSIVFKKEKNNYILLDGKKGTSNQFLNFDNVWCFNIKTKSWKNFGKMNPSFNPNKEECLSYKFQQNQNDFSCFVSFIARFDIKHLRYQKYHFKSINLYRNIIQVGNKLLLFKTTSKPSSYIEIRNLDYLNNFEIEMGDILRDESKLVSWFCLVSFLLILLIVAVIWYFRMKKGNKITLNTKNRSRKRHIKEGDFNPTERKLIELLFKHQSTGLEISFINDLVNHDQPTVETLKKRRELLLKELRFKLATKFQIPMDEVFTEHRMETDKRMKLLFLNKRLRNIL